MNLEELFTQILSGIVVALSVDFIKHLIEEKRLLNLDVSKIDVSNVDIFKLNITGEDLKYLREIASTEIMNKFTSKEIKVEMIHG